MWRSLFVVRGAFDQKNLVDFAALVVGNPAELKATHWWSWFVVMHCVLLLSFAVLGRDVDGGSNDTWGFAFFGDPVPPDNRFEFTGSSNMSIPCQPRCCLDLFGSCGFNVESGFR